MARVLVVDDEAPLRWALRQLLEAEGHEVFEAEGTDAASAVLDREQVDLALVDLIMPGSDGRTLITEIQTGERWPRVKVVAISATLEPALGVAKDLGAVAALQKPFRKSQLLQAIEDALSPGSVVD